jgi:hypothetical protein
MNIPLPVPVHKDLLPLLKTRPLWVNGVERKHNVHSLVNVFLVEPYASKDGELLGKLSGELAKPQFLVIAANRVTGPCDCGEEGCQQVTDKKVTFSMLYEDLMQATSDAQSELNRHTPISNQYA